MFREPHGTPEQRLIRGLELANEEVYSHALANPELRGMGTTAVVALLAPGRRRVGRVGRRQPLYRLRDGALEQLTPDHSLMAEWISIGVITAEAAKTHPRRHELTRALGQTPDVVVEIAAIELRPGDRLLLCSDGLHGSVPEKTFTLALGGHPPAESVRLLVERANAAGGPDNVSVVVVDVPAEALVVGEAPIPEVPLKFALPSPAPAPTRAPAPEPEPEPARAPEVEPPADEMFIEQTSHSSAAIDAAIAELATARHGVELAPASEPDLPPELALGITGSKFEFDLTPPEPDAPDLAATQPDPDPAVAPEAEPLEFAASDRRPSPSPSLRRRPSRAWRSRSPISWTAPTTRTARPLPSRSRASRLRRPIRATRPPSTRPRSSRRRPRAQVQIPLMTPVRKRGGLHAPSVMAGIAAGAVVAVLAAAAWLYTGMGSHDAGAGSRTADRTQRAAAAPGRSADARARSDSGTRARAARASRACARSCGRAGAVPVRARSRAADRRGRAGSGPAAHPGARTRTRARPDDRGHRPPVAAQPPAAPDRAATAPPPASPKLPTSAAFELSAPAHRFVDDWLRAQETHDAALFTSLGFRELPTELAGAWTTRDAYRLVAASVDEERSSPDTLYLRLVVSYAFKDAAGRFRTEDEERLILRNTNGTLRYEGRWSK